jgi:hypothetical protein
MSKSERSVEGRVGRLEKRMSTMERGVSELLEGLKSISAFAMILSDAVWSGLTPTWKKRIKAAWRDTKDTAAGRDL